MPSGPRCKTCRGSGYFIRGSHGASCPDCGGTGVSRPISKDIPSDTRAALRARSGGVCEVCHRAPATDAHHRQFRSRGGDHSIENLLDLCGPGNVFGCHGDAHGFAPPEGVTISRYDRRPPAEIPFTDALGYKWRLNPDGTKEKVR